MTRKPVQTLLRETRCNCASTGTGGPALRSGPGILGRSAAVFPRARAGTGGPTLCSGPGQKHPEPAGLLPLLKLGSFSKKGLRLAQAGFPNA